MIIEKTENGIYKMLDLSDVPKKKWGGREVIDWKKLDKQQIPFQYEEETGFLEVSFHSYPSADSDAIMRVRHQKKEKLMRASIIKSLYFKNFLELSIPKETHKYLINSEDRKLGRDSFDKVECQCPICNHKAVKSINSLVSKGFNCPICNRQLSYPERYMSIYLSQVGVEFQHQKKFPDSSRIFDFYLPQYNTVIETHGIQHYGRGFEYFGVTLKQQQEIDEEKRLFCEKIGVKYVAIDCRVSSSDFIFNSINKSELPFTRGTEDIKKLIEDQLRKQEDVDFDIAKFIKLYQKGATLSDLERNFGVSRSSIKKRFVQLGVNIEDRNSKPIVCINDNIYFSSVTEAGRHYQVKSFKYMFSNYMSGRAEYCGTSPFSGERLQWEYYDDYIELFNLKPRPHNKKTMMKAGGRKIVCVNEKLVFNTRKECAQYANHNYNTFSSGLTSHLKGKHHSCGIHPLTKEPLKWMRYYDYIEKYGTEGLTEYVEDKRELL